MSKNSQIQALCLRYVLPFYYEQSFEKAVRLVKKQESADTWEKVYADTETQESDLFDYIREEFLFERDAENVSGERSGVSWRRRKTGSILELLYFEKPITKKDIMLPAHMDISFTDMGLVLYKNHLGLLWYELAVPYEMMTADQLMLFQNRVKELDRVYSGVYFWEKCMTEPVYGISVPVTGGSPDHSLPGNETAYITPFLMGKWLKAQLSFLNQPSEKKQIHFFAERKSAYVSLIINGMGSVGGLQYPQKALPAIKENESKKDYRKRLKQEIGDFPEMVPDKPLLFSYCLLDLDEDGMPAFTYRLGNGYTPSYLFSPEVLQDMRQPFENAFWFASQEGAAYCARLVPENAATFKDTILKKYKRDYFTLYLKVLYQSFSLLIFAERIQKEVPARLEDRNQDAFTEAVTKLLGEISLFLTKSMATSVSHVHHQSEFYNYLKQRLRVKADVESVTAGMNALEVLMREQAENAEKQRDYRMQGILAIFALLNIFSALADCKGFFENFVMPHGAYLGFVISILVISVITIVYVHEVFIMILKDFVNVFLSLVKKIFLKRG